VPVAETWRALDAHDLGALGRLARRVLAVDGGHPAVADEGFLRSRFLSSSTTAEAAPDEAEAAPDTGASTAGASTAAFDEDGELAAAAGTRLVGPTRAGIGLVDPDRRGEGLGARLLDWTLGQAARIETESLTDAADALFRSRGLARTFAEDIMRADLTAGAPTIALGGGDVTLTGWDDADPYRFFAVYEAAFRERPGFPGWSPEQWTDWIAGDEEFTPQWTLLASRDGEDVGFVAGAHAADDHGWVVQVGVIPRLRGVGLGAGLTAEAMRRMVEGGVRVAMLDVNENNPGAARTYRRLGFATIGRRARYERTG
jgi:mycothiol synthase